MLQNLPVHLCTKHKIKIKIKRASHHCATIVQRHAPYRSIVRSQLISFTLPKPSTKPYLNHTVQPIHPSFTRGFRRTLQIVKLNLPNPNPNPSIHSFTHSATHSTHVLVMYCIILVLIHYFFSPFSHIPKEYNVLTMQKHLIIPTYILLHLPAFQQQFIFSNCIRQFHPLPSFLLYPYQPLPDHFLHRRIRTRIVYVNTCIPLSHISTHFAPNMDTMCMNH